MRWLVSLSKLSTVQLRPHPYWESMNLFFLDFDDDSYAQNSEIIKTIRIQKNSFKIPIGNWPYFITDWYHGGILYHKCGMVYLICGIIYQLWYTKKIKFLNIRLEKICENPNFNFLYTTYGYTVPHLCYTILQLWYQSEMEYGQFSKKKFQWEF